MLQPTEVIGNSWDPIPTAGQIRNITPSPLPLLTVIDLGGALTLSGSETDSYRSILFWFWSDSATVTGPRPSLDLSQKASSASCPGLGLGLPSRRRPDFVWT